MENTFFETKNLSFSHYKQPLTLRDVNLKINKGEKVLILASKDMGKTTFLSVLSSFYDNYFGQIYFNGVELKTIPDENKNFSFLPSKPVFFEKKSIKYNLDFFCKNNKIINFSDDELSKILSENLFDKNIFTKVLNLSLNEKKHLSLIRSLIKNPNIIFVDDQFEVCDKKENVYSSIEKFYTKLLNVESTIFFALSENSLKTYENLFLNLDISRVLYLCDAKVYEFKSIPNFYQNLLNLNQFLFFNCNNKSYLGNIFKSNSKFYLSLSETISIAFSEKFENKLINLNLTNNESEEIVLYLEDNLTIDDILNENFNKYLVERKILIFSKLDGERLI